MKIPAEELKMLLEVIEQGAIFDPNATLKEIIAFFVEKGLTTAEILNQLVQLGYSPC